MAFGFGLTILGTAVRAPVEFHAAGTAVPAIPVSSLTLQEQEDLAAFERHGWRFSSDPGAPAGRPVAGDPSSMEGGVIARRPEGGLVIAENRLVVAFRPGFDPEPLLTPYLKKEPLTFGDNLHTVSFAPQDRDPEEAIEREIEKLKREGGRAVLWVEPVFTFHMKAPPPSPPERRLRFNQLLFTASAALTPAYDSSMQWQWPLIKLSEAWTAGRTRGSGTKVAVIDDGFFLTPQLPGSSAILSLKSDGTKATRALPGAYHGTFCAGLVGSPVDRSLGNGVAPECTLMLVAVSDVMNSDGFAKAVARCADDGADVITCSLGPNGGKWINLKTLQTAIDYVHKTGRGKKGTVVVWAVGNDEELIQSTDLESHAPLLCVGPGDDSDRRGPSGHGSGLDLIAPGIRVRGLRSFDGTDFDLFEDGGASFAAPIVAGIAALVIAVDSTLTWDRVVDIIQRNCDKQPRRPPSADLGWGRVNALKAVTAARPAAPP